MEMYINYKSKIVNEADVGVNVSVNVGVNVSVNVGVNLTEI